MGEENILGERISVSFDLLAMMGQEETTSAEPSLDKRAIPPTANVQYKEYKGQAFAKGVGDTDEVDPNDIKQGALGDCYLCAAMIAVARVRPEKIKSLIAKRPDGTYDVTLHLRAHFWSWDASPQVINVTPTFPSIEGKTAYAQEGDTGAEGPELWGMLIEKAYAQSKGGYREIADGNAGEAAAVLTGGAAKRYDVAPLLPMKIAEIVHYALRAKKAVICNTSAMKEDETLEEMKARAALDIVAHHSYVPKAVDVDNETVDLQNPWGRQDLIGLQIDGPFKKYFVSIDVVTT
jgi:hypothetical protein